MTNFRLPQPYLSSAAALSISECVRLFCCHIYAFAMQTFLMSFLPATATATEKEQTEGEPADLVPADSSRHQDLLFIIRSHKLHPVQCLGDFIVAATCTHIYRLDYSLFSVFSSPNASLYAFLFLCAAEFCIISATATWTTHRPQKQLNWTRNRTEAQALKVAKLNWTENWVKEVRFTDWICLDLIGELQREVVEKWGFQMATTWGQLWASEWFTSTSFGEIWNKYKLIHGV